MRKCLKTHQNKKKQKKHRFKKQNYRYNYFFMANFHRVNGPIDMRVWKGRRYENILKLDRDLI